MILHGGVVITMDPENRILRPGWIQIQDGVIKAVSDVELQPAEGEQRIDASAMLVMPGLVNTHTHLFQGLLRAVYDELPLNEYLTYVYRCGVALSRSDCQISATLGGLEALRSGVTTVTDHHFLNRGDELVTGTVEGLLAAGVRCAVARTVMDSGDGLPDQIKETAERAISSVESLLRIYEKEIAQHKFVLMTGPNTPGINATDRACKAITEFSRSEGLVISAHVAEYAGVRKNVQERYQVNGVVRWLSQIGVLGPNLLAVHAVHIDDDEISMLADARVAVSHNPFSNLFCGNGNAPVNLMLKAGMTVGLGTDGAANNNGQGIFDAARITRLLQRSRPDPFAVPPLQSLRSMTIDGARALGISQYVGSLEPGKRGDVIALALDEPHMVPFVSDPVSHAAHFAKGSDVRLVIVNGAIVVSGGNFQHLDSYEVLRRAQEAGARLVQNLN